MSRIITVFLFLLLLSCSEDGQETQNNENYLKESATHRSDCANALLETTVGNPINARLSNDGIWTVYVEATKDGREIDRLQALKDLVRRGDARALYAAGIIVDTDCRGNLTAREMITRSASLGYRPAELALKRHATEGSF